MEIGYPREDEFRIWGAFPNYVRNHKIKEIIIDGYVYLFDKHGCLIKQETYLIRDGYYYRYFYKDSTVEYEKDFNSDSFTKTVWTYKKKRLVSICSSWSKYESFVPRYEKMQIDTNTYRNKTSTKYTYTKNKVIKEETHYNKWVEIDTSEYSRKHLLLTRSKWDILESGELKFNSRTIYKYKTNDSVDYLIYHEPANNDSNKYSFYYHTTQKRYYDKSEGNYWYLSFRFSEDSVFLDLYKLRKYDKNKRLIAYLDDPFSFYFFELFEYYNNGKIKYHEYYCNRSSHMSGDFAKYFKKKQYDSLLFLVKKYYSYKIGTKRWYNKAGLFDSIVSGNNTKKYYYKDGLLTSIKCFNKGKIFIDSKYEYTFYRRKKRFGLEKWRTKEFTKKMIP